MNKYELYILSSIEENGYGLGKELNLKLQNKFSVSSEVARKTIQRGVLNNIFHSSAPITFGNGQFAYMPNNKNLNREMLLKITKENRPPLYRIISLMDLNKGIISYYEGLKVTGAPLNGEKTKTDTMDKLIKELETLDIIKLVSDKNEVKYLINPNLVEDVNIHTTRHYTRMEIDAMFIPDILRSLQEYNIIDNIRTLSRRKISPSKGITHNNFVWDAIAYTKTTGINPALGSEANTINKQTLVVMDIVIHRPYTDHDFQGFYSRVQSVLNSVISGKRKVLPIIIYASIETQKVYNTIHKLGFLTFDLGIIYGSRIFNVIKNLNLLRLDGYNPEGEFDISKTVEETLKTIKNAGQEDNLKNIKGDLFEFLMYPVFQKIFSNSTIRHSKKLANPNDKKQSHEYDFIINSPDYNETTIIELKGYISTSKIGLGDSEKKNTVSWFFNKTYPFAKKILSAELGNPKVTGCFITSAGFQEEAKKYMDSLNNGKIKPKEMDTWYDGEKLMNLLKEKGLKKVSDIIEKYYIKEK